MTFRNEFKLTRALLQPINTSAIVLLGFFTMAWGLWVANPFWSVFDQAPVYETMSLFPPAVIPPEVFWGGVAVLCGLMIMYATIKGTYHQLSIASALGSWLWFMLGILYFISDFQSTAGVSALGFAAYGAFVYVNIRVNYLRSSRKPAGQQAN